LFKRRDLRLRNINQVFHTRSPIPFALLGFIAQSPMTLPQIKMESLFPSSVLPFYECTGHWGLHR